MKFKFKKSYFAIALAMLIGFQVPVQASKWYSSFTVLCTLTCTIASLFCYNKVSTFIKNDELSLHIHACNQDTSAEILQLCREGANPNGYDWHLSKKGRYPMIISSISSHNFHTFKALLDAGANITPIIDKYVFARFLPEEKFSYEDALQLHDLVGKNQLLLYAMVQENSNASNLMTDEYKEHPYLIVQELLKRGAFFDINNIPEHLHNKIMSPRVRALYDTFYQPRVQQKLKGISSTTGFPTGKENFEDLIAQYVCGE